MSKKSGHFLRVCGLLILLVSLFPVSAVAALVAAAPPPVDMFQLPWNQGIAWLAIDGLDNGSRRPISSSHNYHVGGAIDFAPHKNMVTGEDTSNFWVTAAADGTVIETSSCHLKIAHSNGWLTEYQFLGKIQVKLGDAVTRNQRLGIIADGIRQKYCLGSQEINVPHLHFMLRPSLIGATFAGWQVNYTSLFNSTTFTKNRSTVGLNQPLLNVMEAPPTPTPTASPTATSTPNMSPTPTLVGAYVSTSIDPRSIEVGGTALVTVALNNVPAEGYTSAEFTCKYNSGFFDVSNIAATSLFGPDSVSVINGPQPQSFILAVAGSNGNKATISGPAFTFNVQATQIGQTVIECRARVSQGNNTLNDLPFAVDYLTILGPTPTVDLTPSATPTGTQPPPPATDTPTPSATPGTPTSTPTALPAPGANWLTFTNPTFAFQFLYPPGSQILLSNPDSFTRMKLPFAVTGTNLVEKYLDVTARETTGVCQSPLATESILETSENIVINGIPFLKQTGGDAVTSHRYTWLAFSTSRANVCVSMDFVFKAVASPGPIDPPPPLFDPVLESVMFWQMIGTYNWLALPTATPVESQTPTFTPTPSESATPTVTLTPASGPEEITGHVNASKPVVVSVYDGSSTLVATVESLDGTFSLDIPSGTYTVVAIAPGFLPTRKSVAIISGTTITLPTITLIAGDIDNNKVIDQFDALTIGMSYNSSAPGAADLNNDGIINVLDLEVLAKNYRKAGPVEWL